MNNRITSLFGIKYPIIQGGMIWCSGWELAAAVSNAGGLGIIGSGSMYPDTLKEHIRKCQKATDKPFGVNVPLMYPDIEELMNIILEEEVKIAFTSAGNPKAWTPYLKEKGVTVVQVVPGVKFAAKSEQAGVDAVVVEGFEAGGHNGRDETTTFCLVPMAREAVKLPLIAAGGIGNGRGMLGAMALGADGVQIGTRFVTSEESSAHINFKLQVIAAREGDTDLSLKQLAPVRLIKNKFYNQIKEAEQRGASLDEIINITGAKRSKKGMFEGDAEEGKLEIGQISAAIDEIKPAGAIVEEIWNDFLRHKEQFFNAF